MEKEKEIMKASSYFETLPDAQKAKIKEEVTKLKEEQKVPFIHVFVAPKRNGKEGECYVAYFKPPTKLSELSVFYYDAQSDPMNANLKLAKRLFLSGDKDLVENEFVYMHSGLITFIGNVLPNADADFKTF